MAHNAGLFPLFLSLETDTSDEILRVLDTSATPTETGTSMQMPPLITPDIRVSHHRDSWDYEQDYIRPLLPSGFTAEPEHDSLLDVQQTLAHSESSTISYDHDARVTIARPIQTARKEEDHRTHSLGQQPLAPLLADASVASSLWD